MNLVDALCERAHKTPDVHAYTFLLDGEREEVWLTCAELDRQARAIGARLQAEGLAGERVLLLFVPGLEFISAFLGCMYAGAVAVPAYPPDPSRLSRTLPRLRAIVNDCVPALVLTTSALMSMGEFVRKQAPELAEKRWMASDELAASDPVPWRAPAFRPEDVAFLQYTSGSTAAPKGVVVSHRNLLASIQVTGAGFEVTEETCYVTWQPFYHDLGLIAGILMPALLGYRSVLMSPMDFLKQPLRWLRAVQRYRADLTASPNFGLELCLRRATPEVLAGLELGTLNTIVLGAEPIRPETVEGFTRTFAPYGLAPTALCHAYGLAEAVLGATKRANRTAPRVTVLDAGALAEGRAEPTDVITGSRRLLSAGRPLAGLRLEIVDPDAGAVCPEGCVGEIWLAGDAVAAGYWRRPEDTRTTFQAHARGIDDVVFLRTGDYGFQLEGELYVTGRIKDLIILRGRNLYPQDIELTVERCPGARPSCVAAFALDRADGEALAIVAEVDVRAEEAGQRRKALDGVILAIREAIAAEHGVQASVVALIKPRTIEKTSSGKIQRSASRAALLDGTLALEAIWEDRSGSPLEAEAAPAELRPAGPTEAQLGTWLIELLAERFARPPAEVDVHVSFDRIGLDSASAVELTGALERRLGRRLAPSVFYDHPTVARLARFLASPGAERRMDPLSVARPVFHDEPIAIVGMACRFPGEADSPEAFWANLRRGADAIREVPADHFDVAPYFDPDVEQPGRTSTRWGGFLAGVDRFDAAFFGISPREAERMDPQQRLLLEVAWEALERAGLVPSALEGSATGVFVGISQSDYAQRNISAGALGRVDGWSAVGSALSVAAGRLSYALGLQGPSLAVDTACSSSLVAVYLAWQSLRAGECELALAGGVNLVLSPLPMVALSKARLMSPEGRCKAFDDAADGYVRGEGCGVVALKRLSDALRDGDPIRAVIRGAAVNQDGRSTGLTAPNGSAQQDVIRAALRQAGVAPDEVAYVEAHGTGTALGDPIELHALDAVLGAGRDRERPFLVGSVKTNIGHLESAAGIAGLIKAVLALEHGEVPASLHFRTPNRHVRWDELSLRVASTLSPWTGRHVAGVSSFGFSGTNAHVVLERGPAPAAPRPEDGATALPLVLSARSPEALAAMAREFQAFLTAGGAESLRDISYTASVRRGHHEHCLVAVGSSRTEWAALLGAYVRGEARAGLIQGRPRRQPAPRRIFVFPGQGSQWPGMGKRLLADEPVFRAAIEACDAAIRRHADWSLLDTLHGHGAVAGLDRIDVIQPVLFAMAIALAALWRSWGVEPDAVIGHSMGEVAAACVAGALTLEDGARIICRRSQLLRGLSGQGAMAAVELSMAEAAECLRGYEDRAAIAVSNSPRSTVLAGDPAALREILASLEHRGVFSRWVKVDVASHSPQVDALRGELLVALDGLAPRPGQVPLYSTVTADVCAGGELGADYWVRNLREPVQFARVMERLLAEGPAVFVEVSPHPVLLPAIEPMLQAAQREGRAVSSLRREQPERAVLLESLGALYASGAPVEWSRIFASPGRCVTLPTYPWQRERFWIELEDGREGSAPRVRSDGLLGLPLVSSVHSGTRYWDGTLSTEEAPYLAQHRVEDAVLLPAAAWLHMVLAAVEQSFGAASCVLEDVTFQQALVLPAKERRRVQLALVDEGPGAAAFRISSQESARAAGWTSHVVGRLRWQRTASAPAVVPAPDTVRARAAASMSGTAYYQVLATQGLSYGPAFQRLDEIHYSGEGEALSRVRAEPPLSSGGLAPHPTLLDAGFQLLFGAALGRDGKAPGTGPGVPVALRALHVRGPLGASELWGHARIVDAGAAREQEEIVGDVSFVDASGRVVIEVQGLVARRLDGGEHRQGVDGGEALLAIEWQQAEPPTPEAPTRAGGRWLIFADRGGVGLALQRALAARGEPALVVFAGVAGEDGARVAGAVSVDAASPDAVGALVSGAFADKAPCRGVVHLWSLDTAGGEDATPAQLEEALVRGCGGALHLVQALSRMAWRDPPRLWLVTRGAQAVGAQGGPLAVAQAPVWGLGGVLRYEHPELRCTCVDLALAVPVAAADDAQALLCELSGRDRDEQVALRPEGRFVARLVRCPLPSAPARPLVPVEGRPYRLEIDEPGVLDRLVARACERRPPGPGEVELEVWVAGLNFIDVMKALGIYPGLPDGPIPLGGECAGRVLAVGEGVDGLHVGQEVMAFAPHSLGSHVTVPAGMVVARPPSLAVEQAASIPTVFMTAWYALTWLARLRPGERILIHAAAGGTGMAAMQIAKHLGAEIFATAGTPEKRALVRELGARHVMDSRSLAFADEIMALTGGEGVDVVLNSLAGEAMERSLSVLAPDGRFVELGKRDIHADRPVGLAHFRKSLSYSAVDLAGLAVRRPARFRALLDEVMGAFARGELRPLSVKVVPASRAPEAFRELAQARHTGKLALAMRDPALEIEVSAAAAGRLRPDATYLITGGLGGLGLSVARWMVERGGRHLVLMGRRGASTPAQAAAVAAMEAVGAQVMVVRADVAEPEQLARALAEVDARLPPLRGVIHAAGTLDDGAVLAQDLERFRRVMAPKVAGAWNLHVQTRARNLDFFVLYSSAASLLGSPGQANYAAANAFLDALAHHRHALGLPALTIDWGAFSEVGLAAARAAQAGRFELRGIGTLTPAQGEALLERLLRSELTQVGAVLWNARQWVEFYPQAASSPFLSRVVGESVAAWTQQGTGAVRAELLALEPHDRAARLEGFLREQLALVLRLDSARIDRDAPLRGLGVDSLMALELRNRLEAGLGLRLSATLIWTYPTLSGLAEHLGERLDPAASARPSPVAEPAGDAAEVVDLAGLSDQQLVDELARELARAPDDGNPDAA